MTGGWFWPTERGKAHHIAAGASESTCRWWVFNGDDLDITDEPRRVADRCKACVKALAAVAKARDAAPAAGSNKP